MRSFRRDGSIFEYRSMFTKYPVGLRRTSRRLFGTLPRVRCVELAVDIADAVAHLHVHGIAHRDLKPQNVIVDRSDQRPRLIDFNVSGSTAVNDSGSGRHDGISAPGTSGREATPASSTRTPWPSSSQNFSLDTPSVAKLQRGSLAATFPSRSNRSSTGRRRPTRRNGSLMRRHSATSSAPRSRSSVCSRECSARAVFRRRGPTSSRSRTGTPTSTGSRRSSRRAQRRNAGTRGLDEFSRWAYVQTRIDRKLFDDLEQGAHRLVVITGNAGDGKTAFIQMVESRLAEHGATMSRSLTATARRSNTALFVS